MSPETMEEVAQCYRKAAAFKQRAETASTPTAKAFYMALEKGYRRLAIYKEGLD